LKTKIFTSTPRSFRESPVKSGRQSFARDYSLLKLAYILSAVQLHGVSEVFSTHLMKISVLHVQMDETAARHSRSVGAGT
jgi:hypothetical protein